MEALLNRYILKLRVNGLQNCGLYGNVLLHELFDRNDFRGTRLVQGYITLGEETCWHVWVEDEATNEKYDVISRLATGNNAGFTYLYERPESGAEEDAEVTAEFELYTSNKAEFWKKLSTPTKVKNFRAKMMKKLY
jgi:hypothetical protein